MFLQLVIWLLGHIITLFWGITFPFHYRAFERRGKLIYVHIAIVVLALILPTVSVGIAFGTGGYRYDGIPPLACLPQNLVVAFYAVFLPSTAIVATGGTFLVLIIWKLIKVRHCHALESVCCRPYVCVFILFLPLFLSRSI